jgi:hypothetical protein
MQWEMVELNRLKLNKNRKYIWPVQLAMYNQTVEVTLCLTNRPTIKHSSALLYSLNKLSTRIEMLSSLLLCVQV